MLYRSWVVFSLGGCFPPSSLATAKARYSAHQRNHELEQPTGLSPFFVCLSRQVRPRVLKVACAGCELYISQPFRARIRFGLSRVRSPLLSGISIDFFSSWYSDVSFPRVCVPCGTQGCLAAAPVDWTPFGNLRIDGCLRLPGAFRSLPRPSSPSQAKPFTIQRRCVG